MKNRFNILLPAAALLLLTSCGPSRDELANRIQGVEKLLYAPQAVAFDKGKADSLTALYETFVKEHPKDTLSPGFLFKAASLAMNSGNGQKALILYEQYLKDYPDKPKAPMCLFFKAFVYENLFQDLDKARESYNEFIRKYPKDDFADDAQMALVNLGKTPEMLIKEFEERARADSARRADSLAALGKKGKKH